MKLSRAYYEQDTKTVAVGLLGKLLVVNKGIKLSGKIIETEAYLGIHDKACHSSRGKTSRTAVMFGPAGYSYVYLCYGIHWMFNVVTRAPGHAEAVLIRALEPFEGIETMLKRTQHKRSITALLNGPGKWTKTFGITKEDNAYDLLSERIYIQEHEQIKLSQITTSPRIGIHYAGEEWAQKPLRFLIQRASEE